MILANAALRARVERLLANDIRPDDLTNIFLYIRNGCPSETVREIGDFVAHSDVRTKGLVTDTAKDWLTMFEYQDWIRSNVIPNRAVDLSRRPPNTTAYLKACFRRTDEGLLYDQTGLTLHEAKQVLQKLLKQFESNPDGTLKFNGVTISREYFLLSFLSRINVYGAAFSDETLFEDLKSHLYSIVALKRNEMAAFDLVRPMVSVFALSKMHNVVLKIARSEGKLTTKVKHGNGGMGVWIEGAVSWNRVFEASIDPEIYCEAELLSQPQPWECHIELRPSLKLGRLT